MMRDRILRAVEDIAAEMIDFLCGLTRIPTVNPPGAEYATCAGFVGAKLREFGYEVQQVTADHRPEHSAAHPRVNVMGRLPGARPVLHFNGHIDVVPPGEGWTVDPFGALVRDGRVYGRGTCDQKAGIAASLFAVEAIRRAGIELVGTVEQSATVDEESGGFAGVACLAERGLIHHSRTDYVIITEPTNPDRVCIGHRGVYWFKVVQHGHTGHGSMPFLGVSAADQLGELIHAINQRLKPALAERLTSMPVAPEGARRASVNINAIFGGQSEDGPQTPCVIDRAGAIFDRRFLVEEQFEDVRNEIRTMMEQLKAENPAWRYTIEDLMIVHPVQTDPASRLVGAVAGSIGEIFGRPGTLMASPGTYDHKHVTRIGGVADCVAYGPGILDLAHQPDEYVLIDDVVHSAQVMALAAVDLLGAVQ